MADRCTTFPSSAAVVFFFLLINLNRDGERSVEEMGHKSKEELIVLGWCIFLSCNLIYEIVMRQPSGKFKESSKKRILRCV